MSTRQAIDRLYQVAERAFGIPADALCDESSPMTIAAWDSLGHLNLILAIEAEFGVSFSPDDVIGMGSLGAIRTALRAGGMEI
ncbi:MAG: acyl carrier protein [Acidobacteria bacterium]|nr:MAG: acyl carrier protein [Acidobacteriota bacterium]